nr:uncharacterized protein LOC117278017 [Nicotiana tomentosiformis]
MQDGRVIAYASRKLKVHEKNYRINDLELTKSAYFITVESTYYSEWLAEIYIREIVRLHGFVLRDREWETGIGEDVLLRERRELVANAKQWKDYPSRTRLFTREHDRLREILGEAGVTLREPRLANAKVRWVRPS